MRSLLDGILEATEARYSGEPVIVSEEHNPGNIAVGEADIQRALAGLADGGAWDAREYGITAEQAAAMVRAGEPRKVESEPPSLGRLDRR